MFNTLQTFNHTVGMFNITLQLICQIKERHEKVERDREKKIRQKIDKHLHAIQSTYTIWFEQGYNFNKGTVYKAFLFPNLIRI